MTVNGAGNGWLTPSTVTVPSSIASRNAAWVRGGVRLSSSTRSTWEKIGPGTKVNDCASWFHTDEPVTSLGSRSGAPCTRRKCAATERANACARVVLPWPGVSSMSTWPPERNAAASSRTAVDWPRTTCETLPTMRADTSVTAAGLRTGGIVPAVTASLPVVGHVGWSSADRGVILNVGDEVGGLVVRGRPGGAARWLAVVLPDPPATASRRGASQRRRGALLRGRPFGWRWRWDLNPRRLSPHTLSRRAPSAARTRHRRGGYKVDGVSPKSAYAGQHLSPRRGGPRRTPPAGPSTPRPARRRRPRAGG